MNQLNIKENAKKAIKNYMIGENWGDFLLSHIDPMFTFSKPKAEIVACKYETDDTRSVYLRPNFHWKGFQPGQFLPIETEINGRLVQRVYSLSSTPKDKYLRITVKKQGLVSNHIFSQWQKGMILSIGQATGDFTLKQTAGNLLFLAGGSGITPIYSMLKQLVADKDEREIDLVYFNRDANHIIFHKELLELCAQNPQIRISFVLTHEDRPNYYKGFLTQDMLEYLVPDYQDRQTYLCGPTPLQEKAERMWQENTIADRLTLESFAINQPAASMPAKKVSVKLLQSHKTVELAGEKPLLDELEQAGVFPRSACRIGLCHTCACSKEKGSVFNSKNQQLSHAGKESIQLCVSRAQEDLELHL
ncbi:MAG: ferredoxin reductase [Spirochaetota bacterium]